jgi:hypothetical protein
MNTKQQIIVLFILALSLFVSGCGPGQISGPTITPSPTNTPMPTNTLVPTNTPTSLPPTSTPVPPTATALSTEIDVNVSAESMKLIQAWKVTTAFTLATDPIKDLLSLQGNQIGIYKIEPSGYLPEYALDLTTIFINEGNFLALDSWIICQDENDPFGTYPEIRLFITDDPKIKTINGAAKINFVTKK